MSLLLPKYKNFKQERQIGELTIYLPDPPDLKDVENYKLPQHKQFFTPVEVPHDLKQWDKASRDQFIAREWERRENGHWYLVNGNLEYLTGLHYFYCNYWRIDIGLPKWLDADRDYFYVWDYCVKDEFCAGLAYIANRRDGKTYRATATIYEEISKTPESEGGIQSKNNTDAGIVFNKLIKSWQRLPYFFKPIDVGESHPASRLRFYEPSKRSTKTQDKDYAKVLRSEINYENAKEEAYDGTKKRRYLSDEFGKTLESNVVDRWDIVKECLRDGSDIIGKALHTTTVEEMEKMGGKNAKTIWDASNPNKINPETGETASGLLRYFKPAYYGFRGRNKLTGETFIDAYGYSNQEAAKKYMEGVRAGLTGTALASYKRKYPFTPEEAFRVDAKHCLFDADKIQNRLEVLGNPDYKPWVRGNFMWGNEDQDKDGTVVWVPTSAGRFKLSNVGVPPEDQNRVSRVRGVFTPQNIGKYVVGGDPYAQHQAIDPSRGSLAAAYGFRLYDMNIDPVGKPIQEWQTNRFIIEYLARPETIFIFYEDMIKLCCFLGCQINLENTKAGMLHHFELRGYKNFLMNRPEITQTSAYTRRQKTPGTPATTETTVTGSHLIEAYVSQDVYGVGPDHGHLSLVDFSDLLESWLEFEIDNTTRFDASMGSIYTLIGANKFLKKRKVETEPTPYFKRYDNRGLRSEVIQ